MTREKDYRAFYNTAELMIHYQKRFNIEYPPFYEPIVWIKRKQTCELSPDSRFLITGYDELGVYIENTWIDMEELFEKYVFLDNSIIGMLWDN